MSQALSSSIQLRHIGSMPRSRRASSASEISPLEIRLAAIRVAMNMDSLPKPRLALIAGATASGKSALTLSLAERREGVVINADIAQVYRDRRLVPARPSRDEEDRAPHPPPGHRHGHGPWD